METKIVAEAIVALCTLIFAWKALSGKPKRHYCVQKHYQMVLAKGETVTFKGTATGRFFGDFFELTERDGSKIYPELTLVYGKIPLFNTGNKDFLEESFTVTKGDNVGLVVDTPGSWMIVRKPTNVMGGLIVVAVFLVLSAALIWI